MNKLQEICEFKRTEVARDKREVSLEKLRARAGDHAPRGFEAALRDKADGFALIAEVKKASPSKGLIRGDFRPADHARAYADGGATCLSVLTDRKYFQGHDDYLVEARKAVALPVLRKDFIVDEWQIEQSAALGADAILLIVAALDDAELRGFEQAARACSLDILVEVHNEAELDRALRLDTRLIGVNNRDLKRFQTDIATTERLVERVPPDVHLVSESGIVTHDDCQRLARHGVSSFLVGESLMQQDDLAAATRTLLTGSA